MEAPIVPPLSPREETEEREPLSPEGTLLRAMGLNSGLCSRKVGPRRESRCYGGGANRIGEARLALKPGLVARSGQIHLTAIQGSADKG